MQPNSGFSNPFGNVQDQSNIMNQGGYTGFQSFVPPQQPQIQQAHQSNNSHSAGLRKSKITQSLDKNPNKRLFKGKYQLNCTIPVKYNTVDYFMLVENIRINNQNALRDLKRGKASDILSQVLDSLEFLSYIHK